MLGFPIHHSKGLRLLGFQRLGFYCTYLHKVVESSGVHGLSRSCSMGNDAMWTTPDGETLLQTTTKIPKPSVDEPPGLVLLLGVPCSYDGLGFRV